MAMMSWMRRSARYFLIVVVLTFVASLAYFGATQDQTAGPTAVATVNGEPISAAAYERAYRATVERYRQLLGDRFNASMLNTLRVQEQVLDGLVVDRLVRQRAAAEGLAVSDEELSAEVLRYPAFRQDGQFSHDQYVRVLRRNNLTPAAYEQDLRGDLLQRKLRGLLTDGVRVSEAEVRQYWETRRARVRVGYLLVAPESFLPGPEPADAEVESYYKANPAEFTRPERRRVLMAVLSSASVPPPAVSDADVEEAYQTRRGEFEQPERRRVSHILVRVASTGGSAAEDGARAKAEAALQRVKGGADFAQVAREVSEDPGSAARGGELGLIARGEIVPQFEQLAFSLAPGAVGGPVRSGFGYHVVKVHEVVPGSKKELKEVAPTLRASLAAEGQLRLLRQRADEAQQALLRAADFAAEAGRLGLTVREIGPLAQADAIEGVGRVAEATEAVFGLPTGGVSAPVKVPGGFAVFRLLDKEDPKLSPLAEVRPQVVRTLRRQKAQEAAKDRARQLAEALRAGGDPRALAKDGVTFGETPAFSRANPLGDSELAQAFGSLALDLPEGGVGGPASGAKGLYVVKVLARERPDPADFEGARAETERQLLEFKRTMAWQAWLATLRRGATIEINRSMLPERS
jgi:peptidyl-prolyl cis-trans isomerase D